MLKHRFSNAARCLVVCGMLLFAVSAVTVGAASAAAPAQLLPTKTIKLGDNFFSPSKVTITAGTVVTFKWTGSATHNVTVTKGPKKFTSPNQSDGTYVRTFTKTGTYKIVCTFHPGMTLTVKVKKAPKNAATTTTSPPPSS